MHSRSSIAGKTPKRLDRGASRCPIDVDAVTVCLDLELVRRDFIGSLIGTLRVSIFRGSAESRPRHRCDHLAPP